MAANTTHPQASQRLTPHRTPTGAGGPDNHTPMRTRWTTDKSAAKRESTKQSSLRLSVSAVESTGDFDPPRHAAPGTPHPTPALSNIRPKPNLPTMANPSPLHDRFDAEDAEMMAFGDAASIVAIHDAVETEYARVRNGAAIMDCPHRGLIELTGADRLSFLHALVSNDLQTLAPQQGKRTFLLTAQGRIMADMVVLHGESRTLIDIDTADAATLVEELDKLLFSEDVQIADVSADHHRLSLHGPKAEALLREHAVELPELADAGQHGELPIADVAAQALRWDVCGVAGYHLWAPATGVAAIWDRLVAADHTADAGAKPLGWLAFNMARIEGGTPLYHIDFGPDSLPGETGVADQAVSYAKGCYRGQEVIARMKDLGHPAKVLVGFVGEGEALPVAGTALRDAADGQTVGAVTSSTLSPMRSGRPIGLAMVKWGRHEPDTTLWAPVEAGTTQVTVSKMPFV